MAMPDWVWWPLDNAKYVVPVLVAVTIAQREVRRRRRQDQLRAELHTNDRDEQAES